jgi:2-hydroxy-3-keto-5-methylthiopentenyl-1-phosphate phosphatase
VTARGHGNDPSRPGTRYGPRRREATGKLVPSPAVRPLLIACDFDGTITCRDTLHVVMEAFGPAGLWDSIEPKMRAGELTVEQAMQEEFSAVHATIDEVREVVLATAPLRPGFPALAAWAREEGHELVVMSAGFRSIIDIVFAVAGIEGLEIVSNNARFGREGCEITWSLPGGPCERCGRSCKRHALATRRRGRTAIYIGDGISDRCPSLDADIVFARDGLAEFLTDEGRTFRPYDDFFDIRRSLALASAA